MSPVRSFQQAKGSTARLRLNYYLFGSIRLLLAPDSRKWLLCCVVVQIFAILSASAAESYSTILRISKIESESNKIAIRDQKWRDMFYIFSRDLGDNQASATYRSHDEYPNTLILVPAFTKTSYIIYNMLSGGKLIIYEVASAKDAIDKTLICLKEQDHSVDRLVDTSVMKVIDATFFNISEEAAAGITEYLLRKRGLSKLTVLDLVSGSRITTEYDLSKGSITINNGQEVSVNTLLRAVRLRGVAISSARVFEQVRHVLRFYNFSFVDTIRDNDAVALVSGMAGQLSDIEFVGCSGLGPNALNALAGGRKIARLTASYSSYNKEALAEILAYNARIDYVDLSGNGDIDDSYLLRLFGDRYGHAIVYPNMRVINLSDTHIGDNSIELLIGSFPALADLDVRGTKITSDGVRRLLKAANNAIKIKVNDR